MSEKVQKCQNTKICFDARVNSFNKDTDRDFYMTADEAKKYGLIDEVYKPKNPRA